MRDQITAIRLNVLLTAAILLVVAGYFGFPILFRSILMPPDPEAVVLTDFFASEKPSIGPTVQLWGEAAPELKDRARTERTARFRVTKGEVFIADAHLRREQIIDYLNAQVDHGKIDNVLIFPTQGSTWGEVIPIIAICRQSHVRVVLINFWEV